MYYVVIQNKEKKRHICAFMDQQQFEEDYSPEHGEVIAQGVTKETATKICSENQ